MDITPMKAGETKSVPPQMSTARLMGIVRWLLPLGLAAVAAFFEWSEHIASEPTEISPGFLGEVIIFALLGPIAVAITLTWVARLVAAYDATSRELATANRDLEAKVIERTSHLEAATAELATANDELGRANVELRQLDRLKSEFVSLVSHQLRAPVTNINGALELVASEADSLPPASARPLQILVLESQRLSHIIQTILDVSRIEAGGLSLRLGPVAVEPLLTRVFASALAGEPDRPRRLLVPPGLPPAWADEVLLEEVIRNLLDNALHYAPHDSPIELSAREHKGVLEVAVADHGPGVPAEERERIFQSFHRLGGEDTTVRGYGLGLYFADKLLHAQHGSIAVESPVWDDPSAPGARFVFTLPVATDEPDDSTPSDNRTGGG